MSFKEVIPDVDALFAWVQENCTNPDSELHGPHHWRHVARVGYNLIRDGLRDSSTPRTADPIAVFLFAMFHDSMRENDFTDPDHGKRAAKLFNIAVEKETVLKRVPASTFSAAMFAMMYHTDGFRGRLTAAPGDNTVAVCWDADRLNLMRVGIEPDPLYLSTTQAPPMIQSASALLRSEPPIWPVLAGLYVVLEEMLALNH